MKRRAVLRAFKIGIIRLLAPDVSGSISAIVDMMKGDQKVKKKKKLKIAGRISDF